ncbi:MAG: DEAD/DEAH box helicase [Candidatus Micrarchaeota archaeon]|nr:DEAD/DEAH box helicase [Candidatus Micrarchaeota archaeon]
MPRAYEKFLKRYGEFTDIQKNAMPIIESGSNCIAIAPTGAGKTEAAMLPLLDKISEDKERSGIKIIYITPLRALNRDMIKRLDEFCRSIDVTIAVRHGDTPQSERARQTRVAPMVLITTPETLQSIMPTKSVSPHLRNVKAVVVDEIHELYYSKRGAQLSVALERLEELAPGFQRIGLSATVGDIETAAKFLCNKRECKIAKSEMKKSISVSIELPKNYSERLKPMIDKFNLDDDAIARLGAIASLVSKSSSTLIFANTRQIVEALGSRLVYLNGIESFGGIGVHHSSLDRDERIEMENRFKDGKIRSIIATSSLELGIDIGQIDLVIQYGSPRQSLRLVQRVGRSGHTQKGVSKGTIIAINQIEALEAVAIYQNALAGSFEKFAVQEGSFDVLANQICGIALDKQAMDIGLLHSLLKRSYTYRNLELERLDNLLKFMSRQRMVGFDGKIITAGPRTRMYYYGHLSVIPDTKRFIVKNVIENRIISSLDERFVANNVDENSVFITKGLPWKVISIDKDVISVEPSMELEAAVPDWTGEDIPVSHETVQGVFSVFRDLNGLGSANYIDSITKATLLKFAERQKGHFIPSKAKLFVEQLEGYKILYTGLGTQANEALSRLLAHILSMKLGRSINIKSSPYLVFMEVGREADVKKLLLGLSSGIVESRLLEAVTTTDLFRYKFVTVAKLFGIIDRDAVVSKSVARRLLKVFEGTPVYEETIRELMGNYFNVKLVKRFFDDIHSGALQVQVMDVDSISPLTNIILNSAYYTKELISPLTPNSELVESFSKFILSKEISMICTHCGFRFKRKLNEVKDLETIACPSCASPMISLYDDTYVKVIEKRIEGKRLSPGERQTMSEIIRYANLFSGYGGRAAVALSVYGIGAKTAARALMMFKHDEKSFFIDLIEAQKNFIRTKKYWTV